MTTSPSSPHAPRAAEVRALARARWQALAPRERLLVTLAAWALGLAALWTWGLQQPLQAGRQAQARLERLDDQWLVMQRQAAEAQTLKTVAPLPPGQADQALQAATSRLGTRGRLARQGARAVLTVEGVSPSELQAWWAETRAGARARPVEMQLSRNDRGLTGTLTVTLGETP
jgi:general secretion pathway protein M